MFLQTKDGSIYYEAHGKENQPAIVFTHGAGLNCRMYDTQIEALKESYRIVVWDMPGHGRSHRLSASLEFSQQSANIIAIMDELNIKQAVLGGQSLGSWISQHGAVQYPDRVKGVISLGGLPLHKPLSKLYILMFQVSNEIFRLYPEKPLFRWVARQKAVTPEAQEFAQQSMNEIGYKQFYHVMKGMLDGGRIDVTPPTQPILMTHGDQEMPKSVAKDNAQWHEDTPGSMYAVLANAGHNGNQDNPQAFNEAVIAFMTAIPDKGDGSFCPKTKG